MIRSRVSSNKEAASLFQEWPRQSFGNVFMILTVYADESGTHDPEQFKLPGAKVPVISGYIDTLDNWKIFCDAWKPVLDKNGLQFFHYADTHHMRRKDAKNIYFGWSDEKINDLVFELAEVVTRSAISIGGHSYGAKLKQFLFAPQPFDAMLEQFFNSFTVAMNEHFPHFDGTVDFIFDQQEGNEGWNSRVESAFMAHKKHDARLGGFGFHDKKKFPHWPLQAADMNAYSTRQAAEKFYTEIAERPNQLPRIIDIVLQRNGFPKSFEWNLSEMQYEYFKLFIQFLRMDEREQVAEWAANGIKKGYFPSEHKNRIMAKMAEGSWLKKIVLPRVLPPPKFGNGEKTMQKT
jgi:hypothetical protein